MSDQTDPDPSDSSVQGEIERIMLDIFREGHPNWVPIEWKQAADKFHLPAVWQKAQPDAVWETENGAVVIGECYARVDKLKPGHRRKLAFDALKLLSLRNAVPNADQIHCILIVPEQLERQLHANDWFSEAIGQAVEVIGVKLPEDQLEKLETAVKRQASGQARLRKMGGNE